MEVITKPINLAMLNLASDETTIDQPWGHVQVSKFEVHSRTFEQVFADEQLRLVRAAYLLLRSEALAEEAVQEAFIKLFDRFDSVRNPGGFLYTTTINRCRDLQRRRSKERSILGRLRPVQTTDDMSEPLDDLLAGLSNRWREIIVLRYYVGHSTVEIAQILGIPEGTVRSSIHKALNQLRVVKSDA